MLDVAYCMYIYIYKLLCVVFNALLNVPSMFIHIIILYIYRYFFNIKVTYYLLHAILYTVICILYILHILFL